MKIFVFTYDRYDTISTTVALDAENIDYTCLCHTEQARQAFNRAGRVNPDKMLVTSRPKGLSNNRNSALELMNDGEWALFLVDDWIRATELDNYDTETRDKLPIYFGKSTTEWGKHFAKEITMAKFITRAEELAEECDRQNITLGGFAGYTNPAYRTEKYKRNILADGRAIIVKKTKLKFDTNIQLIDDLAWCAENIVEANGCLVNQWILPECKRYTAGAFGTIDERMEQKIRECSYLVKKFPRLVKYKSKAGWPDKSHITLTPMKPEAVERYKVAVSGLRQISGYK